MPLPPEVELETAACPLGCSDNDIEILTGYDRLHGLPGEFTVVKCRTCGLIRTNPRPTPATIGYYYPANYQPYLSTQVTERRVVKKPLWKKAISSLIRFNAHNLPPMMPGRMLEVGCASGTFLHQMAQQGWEVEGIEPDATAAQAAQNLGYHVYNGNLESAPAPTEPYDLVVGWMVVEHLHAPVESLKRLQGWVKPGGWIVFSVPNAASFEFRLFGKSWYALELPRHLTHFSPKTVRKVLDQSGWQTDHVFHQRNMSNLIASIGYAMQSRGLDGKFARWLIHFPESYWRNQQVLYPIAFVLSLFGQTGRMTIWAKKKP